MPTLLFFLAYLVASLLLAALLYVPVFQALDTVMEVRADRVFYRLAMVIAILGFWPYLKLLAIDNRNALGYSQQRARFLLSCAKGFGIGVIIMAIHTIALLLPGIRVFKPGDIAITDIAGSLLAALLSGLLVAIIEETLFRGAMYYHMRRHNRLWTTLVLTSLFYAAVHFTRPSIPAGESVTDWHSGLNMLSSMLHQYHDFPVIADSFAALFCAGLLLGLVREKSGSIALCIGIHAGWVWMIKLARELTEVDRDSPLNDLIGSYDGIIGWAATGILLLVTLGYWRYSRAR
jgi:membrane protease YdiL (CAAX protease family)